MEERAVRSWLFIVVGQALLEEKSNLAAEKATLFSQLQSTTEKLEKLSEKSNLLENSLFDVNAELEGLRVKSKVLEDTCRSLDHEKSSICQEKETLVSLLNITHQTLKDLEMCCSKHVINVNVGNVIL